MRDTDLGTLPFPGAARSGSGVPSSHFRRSYEGQPSEKERHNSLIGGHAFAIKAAQWVVASPT